MEKQKYLQLKVILHHLYYKNDNKDKIEIIHKNMQHIGKNISYNFAISIFYKADSVQFMGLSIKKNLS